jgi:hypothetical protein
VVPCGSETLFTLTAREGRRTDVHARVWTSPPRGRPLQVGAAQSWYYPADHTAVIWELLLTPAYMCEEPAESLLLRSLWTRYEVFLAERYPGLQQYMTTWEDDDQRPAWEAFLSGTGYCKTAAATFGKRAPRTR